MITCWYCGTADPALAYEREHQLPLSLGGGGGADNIVDSCRACNRLKASRSVDQFRLEIECRLGTPVTFAGEATPTTPATDITAVRSFAAQTGRMISSGVRKRSEGRRRSSAARSAAAMAWSACWSR